MNFRMKLLYSKAHHVLRTNRVDSLKLYMYDNWDSTADRFVCFERATDISSVTRLTATYIYL